jgi:hypothetical protein
MPSARPKAICVAQVVLVSQSASRAIEAKVPRSAYMPLRGVVSKPTKSVAATPAPSVPPLRL